MNQYDKSHQRANPLLSNLMKTCQVYPRLSTFKELIATLRDFKASHTIGFGPITGFMKNLIKTDLTSKSFTSRKHSF